MEGFCQQPPQYVVDEAQEYYNDWTTAKVDKLPKEKVRRMFGCLYQRGDEIFLHKTFFRKKYILVRYGKAVTFYSE